MPTRDATTQWQGDLQTGTGLVTLDSSNAGQFPVTFPSRAGEPDGHTSPEELIAAAHSSCYAMQFSALLGGAGATDISLSVAADVALSPDPAGGFRISRIVLHVGGQAGGVDPDTFAKLAEEAKAGCPVSKALTGTSITLELG
jgi:osmotically inducible protein OsmC